MFMMLKTGKSILQCIDFTFSVIGRAWEVEVWKINVLRITQYDHCMHVRSPAYPESAFVG